MNWSDFWFAAIPNVALIALVIGAFYRMVTRPVEAPSPRAPDAAARWGRIPLQRGLVVVLGGHLLALLVPGHLQAWNATPVRLYVLEATGLAFALWTLMGLIVLVTRHVRGIDGPPRASIPDLGVALGFGALVVSGILVAVLYRWGSTWGAAIMSPYVRSVPTIDVDADLIGDLPVLVQVHVVTFWGTLALFPHSRWFALVMVPVRFIQNIWQRLRHPSPEAAAAGSASPSMSWGAAYAWAVAILVVSTVTVVYLPSRLLTVFSSSPQVVQDLIGPGVWSVALVGLLAGLRWAQRTGRI